MSLRTDVYTAITPFGIVEAEFPEDGGVFFIGPDAAIEHLKAVISENTGAVGVTLSPETVEPNDFYHFCQPQGSGVTIMRPLDDLLAPDDDVEITNGDGVTLDESGSLLSPLSELRIALRGADGIMAKLAIMADMLMLSNSRNAASADDADGYAGPRNPSSQYYEFDPNRKQSQRKKDNEAAMVLLARIQNGDISADSLTSLEKQTLAKYSGTGGALIGADGKKGSAFEYYTPKPVATGIWDLLGELGFSGGKVLDPCAGVGVFGATAPLSAAVDAVELNETSGTINGLVNNGPGYTTTVSPFEKVAAATPDESYDAIVSNVPFGEVADRGGNQLHDKRYQKEPIQNYFILRSLEKLKPGGLACFITPPRCVTGKGSKETDLRVRASYMAEFMGAYRLPNSVFGTAAADTMTDVIVFRKYRADVAEKIAELREQSPETLVSANVQWPEFIDGLYFQGEGRRFVLGEFVPKDPNKFRDVDRVISNASIGEIGQMLKKFPGSRIDWSALDAVETTPIIYRDGDTITQAGQTLQMKDGQWIPLAAGKQNIELAKLAGDLATPYAAFESRATFDQATQFRAGMIETSQSLDIPGWLNAALRQLAGLMTPGEKADYWNAGIVGMAAAQVLKERMAEEVGVNYVEEYAALSDAMQRMSATAKARPGSLTGQIKDGLNTITTHYSKKTGFSAVWRGDVNSEVNTVEVTADGSFEGLRYESKSIWVDMGSAKAIYGENFDPLEDANWCISADGRSVTKADDYYSGNYAEFIKRIDGELAAATDDRVRGKLLRQKLNAESRIDRVDVSQMSFNLFTPHVTDEEKAEFLRRFVHPAADVIFDEKTGKKRVDIDVKGSNLSDREKLINRMGDYLKNGTPTLGGLKLSMDNATALRELRKMVNTANEQFNGWARANHNITARLEEMANAPSKLRFRQVDDESPMPIPGMSGEMPLHGYQNAFVRKMGREFGGVNGDGVGLGKAQPLDAKILTPDGWKRMGDISIGDKVIAVDGSSVSVTGVFPQGEKEIFEVEFSDGAKARCCDEHLWHTETELDRKRSLHRAKKGISAKFGSAKQLSEIRATLIHGKKQKNHKIPMVSPILFPEKIYPIHPYIMGAMLGDGAMTTHSVTITPGDAEIAEKIGRIAEKAWPDLSIKSRVSTARAQSYAVTGVVGQPNALLTALREFGLIGCRSEKKFVPDCYMIGSVSQRVDLLHGLMDTDGYVSKDGITVQFSSSSERLALAVRELVQSLGGIAWISTKIPTYTHNGEKRTGLLCYTVAIRMPQSINPFSLKRKAERVVPKTKYVPVRFFVDVKSVGSALAQCISIDHPTHLYVTDDYVVTHNTVQSLAAVQYAQSIGVKKKTVFVVPNSVLSNWRKESGRAYANTDDCLFVGLRIGKDGNADVKSSAYDADLTSVMENRHSKIFMTMEAFERIRLREQTIADYERFLRGVDASFAESEDKKKDEQAKSKQASLMAILADKAGGAPFLEDMGVDSIVVDEAHALKNSSNVVSFKGAKFLSLADAAKRGIDAQAKFWYIRGQSPLKDGVLLLTATPLTNSPLEIYSLMSLAVGHERVNDMCLGIKGADNFMDMMCVKVNEDDVTMDGVARTTDVFTGLTNVDVLRKAIGQISTIRTADDVGEQIIVPDRDEVQTAIQLPGDIVSRLTLYKQAFRYAVDEIAEKVPNRGSKDAFDAVQTHFDEGLELIGHPFNLINKMTLLIADPELDQRGTFYIFTPNQKDKAEEVVKAFNAKKYAEKRNRTSPLTKPSSVISRTITKDEEGNEAVKLKITVEASINEAEGKIVIDTMDSDTQSTFEAMAEKAGLNLDVSIPPKLAAMLENFQKEQAHPRGISSDGQASKIVKQIIFCDVLALHNKIKRLISKRAGIPASAIAIITGKVNNKPDEILAVQDGFNADGEDNKFRVVIANEKAEVGINLQKGTQAIHHLTIGWTPDSLEQRNGRGVRQGNRTAKVTIYHYDADGTFDSSKRTMVNKKADWIDNVMDSAGGNTVAVTGGLSREQQEALIDVVGDSDAVRVLQESIAAKEAAARAAANRERQIINLDTIRKQRDFIVSNESAVNFVIRKLIGLRSLKQKAALLRSRISNPNATESAIAKNEAVLSEVNGSIAGLMQQITESATISQREWRSGGSVETEITPDKMLSEFARYASARSSKDEDLEKSLLGRGHPSFKVTIIEGGPIQNEWQSEIDMAQSMVDESVENFRRQSQEGGGFPVEVAKAMSEGKGMVWDGRIMVIGTFVRVAGGLAVLNMTGDTPGAFGRGMDGSGLSASQRDIMAAEWVYPGSTGYSDCLNDAAAIEDIKAEQGEILNGFSDIVPEVATRRKNERLAEYSASSYMLPSPYFPYVFSSTEIANSPIRQRISKEQDEIIKSRSDYGFKVPSSLDVTRIPNAGSSYSLGPKAVIEYAKANGLKLAFSDLNSSAYSVSMLVGEQLSLESFRSALAGDTAEEIRASAVKALEEGVKLIDYTGINPIGDNMLPYSYRAAINAMIDARSPKPEVVEPAVNPVETPVSPVQATEGSKDDIVGITGDTRTYMGAIKAAANFVGKGKFKWHGKTLSWCVYRSTWNYLVQNNPGAANGLRLVPSPLSYI